MPRNIYNTDKSALYYNLLTTKTPITILRRAEDEA